MSRSALLRDDSNPGSPNTSTGLEDDPRWALTQRVVAGPHFARSPLLSKLLLDIVSETLQGRHASITEHKLGVRVFGRPLSYRTVDDNIVRNYARQLRKRLAEHFQAEGSQEAGRIHIPVGGYVPCFTFDLHEQPMAVAGSPVLLARPSSAAPASQPAAQHPSPRRSSWRLGALAVYSCVLIGVTYMVAAHAHRSPVTADASTPLWKNLFTGNARCYIVPDDAGLNLIEDFSRGPLTLADYMQGSYQTFALPHIDAHSLQDLRTQQFTSFVGMEVVAGLVRRPEFNAQHVLLRFPRDLRLDDLKDSNAVIIGSVGSNPWAAVPAAAANFQIVNGAGMTGASILNRHPRPGEAASYVSHWNEPTHQTFALIAFLPNLGGGGHLLMLEGLDAAGTQSAAETLFHSQAITDVLHRATLPDGSMRAFEVLLSSTSMQSNAINTKILATRIY